MMRAKDAFVYVLPMLELGYKRVEPKAAGKPSFDPSHEAIKDFKEGLKLLIRFQFDHNL